MSNPVSPDSPVFISIAPSNIAVAFGTTVQMMVTLHDVDGNVFSPTAPILYSSSNPVLATVDSSGLVTVITPSDPNALNTGGYVTITATTSFQNRTFDTDAISADSFLKVLANAAKTQIVVRAVYLDYTGSGNLVNQVVPATSPSPSYPPGWNIQQ